MSFETWYAQHNHNGQTVKQLAYAAWLAGRDFVSPEDIQAVLFDVLRHRIILSFEAEAAGIDQDRVIQRILDVVAVA